MRQRQLGRGGPSVSAIGLGCMGMSWAYGQPDDPESIRTMNRALDLGVNHLDTADTYGLGANERLVGQVARARRDEVFLATKFGNRSRTGRPAVSGSPDAFVDSSPAWAREACDASLSRLGIDTIDLYYLHRRNPEVPIEDTVGAMASLVDQGKVRYLGLSEVSPATLRAAHAVHPIAAVQLEYSLFTREVVEGEMLDTCRELGVAVVAYSPVGRGWLTGTVTSPDQFGTGDFRSFGAPQFNEENFAANLALAEQVKAVAAEIGREAKAGGGVSAREAKAGGGVTAREAKAGGGATGCTPAQAALAWLLAQGEDILPIPGTKRVRYLEENTAAADITLTADQLHRLSDAVPTGAVAGTRYSAAALRLTGQ